MWLSFSRMDFPSPLPPSLFMTGPLGLSGVPDVSFMCSWRDALTLPEPQPRASEVRVAGGARVVRLAPPLLAQIRAGILSFGDQGCSAVHRGFLSGSCWLAFLPPSPSSFLPLSVQQRLTEQPLLWASCLPAWHPV